MFNNTHVNTALITIVFMLAAGYLCVRAGLLNVGEPQPALPSQVVDLASVQEALNEIRPSTPAERIMIERARNDLALVVPGVALVKLAPPPLSQSERDTLIIEDNEVFQLLDAIEGGE